MSTFTLMGDVWVVGSRQDMRQNCPEKESMSEIKIHSANVILIEGCAHEFVPNAKPATDMHGFVIMVPPGEGSDWLLDMVWRISMAYAGLPRLLMNRGTVRKMVEAVMSTNAKEPKRAHSTTIESRAPKRAQHSRNLPAKADIDQTPTAKARSVQLGRKAGPTSASEFRGKASARKRS